jgi:hypothetical protein
MYIAKLSVRPLFISLLILSSAAVYANSPKKSQHIRIQDFEK